MFPPEDAYGYAKCLSFLSEAVSRVRPARVLDVGCGTGEKLTWPLAKAHPAIRFLGADDDARSIEHARRTCLAPNLRFIRLAQLQIDERFDLIVASEVLEHVAAPVAFLRDLRSRLAPAGCIVVTVPNGYGPSETASLLETLLALTGFLGIARAAKRRLRNRSGGLPPQKDTLAVSPHINFFSWREIQRVIAASGLRAIGYRARTLFCGFGFDLLIRGASAARWNADMADRMPAIFVSGWMFVLEPVDAGPAVYEHRRGALSRMRRWLNEKRWRLR